MLSGQAGFAPVLDAIGTHCLGLRALTLDAAYDEKFHQPSDGVAPSVALLDGVLQLPSLEYLDLDLPFMSADLARARTQVLAPLKHFALCGDGRGLEAGIGRYVLDV